MVLKTGRVALAGFLLLTGCTSVPQGLTPVDGFDLNRYLGTWYEIARLDHRFERGMSNVSATYSDGEAGTITVVNRGFVTKSGKWKEIQGVARPIGDPSIGSLKVSFFKPFYGGYHVVDLDKEAYRYAMVVGPSRSYFWILSRDRKMDQALLEKLINRAAAMGIATDKLIFVAHDGIKDEN